MKIYSFLVSYLKTWLYHFTAAATTLLYMWKCEGEACFLKLDTIHLPEFWQLPTMYKITLSNTPTTALQRAFLRFDSAQLLSSHTETSLSELKVQWDPVLVFSTAIQSAV